MWSNLQYLIFDILVVGIIAFIKVGSRQYCLPRKLGNDNIILSLL